MQKPIIVLDVYKQALGDFPFAEFHVHGRLHRRKRDDYVYVNECTFEPEQLVRQCYRRSGLGSRKNYWGWGLIDVKDEVENGEHVITIEGYFDVADKEDWMKRRLYPESKGFWGNYSIQSRTWSFHFGR
jgi:hypothetical protein